MEKNVEFFVEQLYLAYTEGGIIFRKEIFYSVIIMSGFLFYIYIVKSGGNLVRRSFWKLCKALLLSLIGGGMAMLGMCWEITFYGEREMFFPVLVFSEMWVIWNMGRMVRGRYSGVQH